MRVLGTRWVFTVVPDSEGRVAKFKARWVIQGCGQTPGKDYTDTFSPVVHTTTLRLFWALTSVLGYHKVQLDVKAAYLNGAVDEEIYVRLPEGYQREG